MKYCPYCGASLPGSAVSFCPECGKGLPRKKTQAQPQKQKRRPPSQPGRKADRPRRPQEPPNPMDIGYDGYYDDVQPLDAGARGEGMDPELMKRVGLVILGAVGVICLAIILMMVL